MSHRPLPQPQTGSDGTLPFSFSDFRRIVVCNESGMSFFRSYQASIKHGLPAFPLDGFHPQRPHDLPDRHGGIFAILIFPFGVAVKIFLEAVMQVNFIGQPWVDGAPVGRLGLLVVSLLDHAQSPVMLLVKCADAVDRVVAAVDAPVVARPLFGWYLVISHKNKESPQLSPRTLLGSSFTLFP